MCSVVEPAHVSIVGGGTAQIVVDSLSQYPFILFSGHEGCAECLVRIEETASVQIGDCWRHTLLLSYPRVQETKVFTLSFDNGQSIEVTLYPCEVPKYVCPDPCEECHG